MSFQIIEFHNHYGVLSQLLSNLQSEEMIKEIKTAFKKNLPNLDWMDDATRRAAIDKVSAVQYEYFDAFCLTALILLLHI